MGDRIQVIYEQPQTTQIYGIGRPFAIRKTNWFADYYVIVEQLHQGNGYGVPMRKGEMSRLFEKDEAWRQCRLIPDSKISVWELKEEVDLSYYQQSGELKVYELHHRLLWSKQFPFWSIAELCLSQWKLIKWFQDKLETEFCLSERAMGVIKRSGILERDKDAEWFLELNKEKLKWYKSGLQPELIPRWYKNDPTRRINTRDLGQVVARAAQAAAALKGTGEEPPFESPFR